MKASTRYGMAGIGALSLLTGVQWLREAEVERPPTIAYLLGVGPNFAAALAIAFVLLSIWADQNREATFNAATRSFFVCAAISGLGLLGWEILQRSMASFVFDWSDIGATIAGIGLATLLFYLLTPRQAGD